MNKQIKLQDLNKIIAERVRTRRKALGLTQEQLAEKLDLSVTYVAKLEGADRTPSLSSLLQLADALDLHIADLLETRQPSQAGGRADRLATAFVGLNDIDADFLEQELLHLISHLRKRLGGP